MSAIAPLTFFLWDTPRLLIDIRPRDAFVKGTLDQAISIPINDHDPVGNFQSQMQNIKSDLPIHLIDLDGKISRFLSESIPLGYMEGGYKVFKTSREKAFEKESSIRIMGGYTGSGKTGLLQCLRAHGHQVIDLEQLASHKGSVFGYSKENPQPLHEDFQNRLLSIWLSLDPKQPIWMEEKGPFLGKAGLPKSLYSRMLLAPLIHLDVPFEERLEYILQTYGAMEPVRFKSALRSLEDRMGTSANHKALHYNSSGQKEKCFELLLKYYDSAYERRRRAQWEGEIIRMPHHLSNEQDTLKIIESLIK